MGIDEVISVFSFNVQIFSSTRYLLSSNVTLLLVSFDSFDRLFFLSNKRLSKIFGESLPSCGHGVIACFEDDFFFISIDGFLRNNVVVQFEIERYRIVADVFKLFILCSLTVEPHAEPRDFFH